MSPRLANWAARQFPLVLPLVLLALAWPWAVYGFVRMMPIGDRARRLGWLGAMLSGIAVVVWCEADLISLSAVFLLPVLLMGVIQSLRRPRLEADWVDEQALLATARIDGDRVAIRNFRHTIYRSLEDYDVQFLERSFDLSTLCRVDFLVVPFSSWRGIAHVFVSFGFSDGDYLAVSVEARRQVGEPYSPVGGLYQEYEVIYVLGDERDLIGKRALFQKNPVHLYPIISDAASARAILVGMLGTANSLAERPQFYHSVTNTCTSNVLVHATGLKKVPHRYDFRLVFPGFADSLAVESGLIDAPEGLAALREATLINGRAAAAPLEDGRAWSRALRGTGPAPQG